MIVSDLLIEIVFVIVQIGLLGSAGVIAYGTMFLTILATVYNIVMSIDALRKIYRRTNLHQVGDSSTMEMRIPKK